MPSRRSSRAATATATLRTRMAEQRDRSFPLGAASGVELVDTVTASGAGRAAVERPARYVRVFRRRREARPRIERRGAVRLGRSVGRVRRAGVGAARYEPRGARGFAPSIPGRARQRNRRCGESHGRCRGVPAGRRARATGRFSPAAEQCRIRRYFCRPLGLDARICCALSGFPGGSASRGGGIAPPVERDGGSRVRGRTWGCGRSVRRSDRGLRPRPCVSWGSHRCGYRHGRASADRRACPAVRRGLQGERRRRRRSRSRVRARRGCARGLQGIGTRTRDFE